MICVSTVVVYKHAHILHTAAIAVTAIIAILANAAAVRTPGPHAQWIVTMSDIEAMYPAVVQPPVPDFYEAVSPREVGDDDTVSLVVASQTRTYITYRANAC